MTTVKQNRMFHLKICNFQLFSTPGCTHNWLGPMKREKVDKIEILLMGDDVSTCSFSAGTDSVCTRRNNLRWVSRSSSVSVIDPLLVWLPLKIGKTRNIYATKRKRFSQELYFCHSKVDSLMLTCVVSVLISWVSISINSVPAATFLDFIFVITSEQGINGQLGLLKKSRPFNQLPLPASAGLSTVGTWLHLSSVVGSRFSVTRFATKTGCISNECSHCSTVVLTVHMKHFSIVSENARCIFCRNRDASKPACNSNFGI